MKNVTEITSVDDERVSMFTRLTEAQLRSGYGLEHVGAEGLCIVESPKVITVALDAGWEPVALLAERRHLEGDARQIVERMGEAPVYTGSRTLLAGLTGYVLTRGVLCAMRRRRLPSAAEVLRGARRVAVMEGVTDTTNVGAIFRSAAALGVDGVLLTRDTCDPLNRRAIRVSMGSVFLVPWTWWDGPVSGLRAMGLRTAALALRNDAVALDDRRLAAEPRLALVLGTEGDGLPERTISEADYVVRIPMAHGVDSLNVGAAAAVAFWELCK